MAKRFFQIQRIQRLAIKTQLFLSFCFFNSTIYSPTIPYGEKVKVYLLPPLKYQGNVSLTKHNSITNTLDLLILNVSVTFYVINFVFLVNSLFSSQKR